MLDINLKGAVDRRPPRDPAHDRRRARRDRQQLLDRRACAGWAACRTTRRRKWGLTGLTKSWAIELAPHGIRVVSIHPTGVDTPLNDGLAAMEGKTPREIAEALGGQPAAGAVGRDVRRRRGGALPRQRQGALHDRHRVRDRRGRCSPLMVGSPRSRFIVVSRHLHCHKLVTISARPADRQGAASSPPQGLPMTKLLNALRAHARRRAVHRADAALPPELRRRLPGGLLRGRLRAPAPRRLATASAPARPRARGRAARAAPRAPRPTSAPRTSSSSDSIARSAREHRLVARRRQLDDVAPAVRRVAPALDVAARLEVVEHQDAVVRRPCASRRTGPAARAGPRAGSTASRTPSAACPGRPRSRACRPSARAASAGRSSRATREVDMSVQIIAVAGSSCDAI